MATELQSLVDQEVIVVTNDGRIIVGKLKGFDQCVNIVLEDSHERVFFPDAPMEEVLLGLHLIRGDNIAMIGESDAAADAGVDYSGVRAQPLKPVTH